MRSERKPWTLRGRLLRLFLVAAAGVWTLSGVLLFFVAERNNSDDWDTALRRSGTLLLSMIVHEYQEGSDLEEFKGARTLDLSGFMVQVWDRDGRLLLKSANAPAERLIADHEGFHNVHLETLGPWRVTVLVSASTGLELLLAEHEGRRTHEANQLALSLLAPLILGLPLMALLAWPFAARAVQPLSAATRAIAERPPNDLGPIPSGELPDEFQPLVDEFNGLLSRLVMSLEGERRFAANLAHELRTPLASLSLNTQLLLSRYGEVDLPERTAISASIDRMSRTIEQLIALARIELTPSGEMPAGQTMALARLIQETINELAPAAERRGIDIRTNVESIDHAPVPQALYLVLRNLLENAIKFAQTDGVVLISGQTAAEGWWLKVEDDGPGLVAESDGAPQTGWSGPASNESNGLGLGLKLVRRTADLIGAQLKIDRSAELGGAAVSLSAGIFKTA